MTRILVVEDEPKIARLLQLELNHEGFETRIASDGMAALDTVEEFSPDVILLDIMIPEIDGVEVARSVRQLNPEIGIIMVTALDQTRNKVEGLQSGADDYITKPFELEEVKARISALLRRKQKPVARKVSLGESLDIYPESYLVKEDGKEIPLSRTEFDLLSYLAANRNQVISKEELLEKVWGIDFDANPNVVEVYINYLRKKLKAGKELIRTVRGVGYTIREG
ncbi:MAG TPA: response regulator transcription factor [Thermotogota bacterium]|nr:response regulator transcription factor [Thermotogota bacterium]